MNRVESRRHQPGASICLLPVEMQEQCLILPAMTCGICEVLPTGEAHLSASVQSFYWESVTWALPVFDSAVETPAPTQQSN